MLNKIIQYSLHNRLLVMIAAVALLIWGSITAHNMEVDVFPDLNAPTVVVMTEAQGMAPEEVEEYITQIAFSGATDFIEKYKDNANGDEIIGHFGLGFYSAFMVADEVHIDTLSYKEGSTPVHWTCDGGTEYEMADGNKTEPGTEITLFLNEESLEFANEYRMREVIEKYCSFMPVNIYLSKANAEQEYETIDESELRDDFPSSVVPVCRCTGRTGCQNGLQL